MEPEENAASRSPGLRKTLKRNNKVGKGSEAEGQEAIVYGMTLGT